MTPTLEDRCFQLIEGFANQQQWSLPAAGVRALAKAILPALTDSPHQDAAAIEQLAAAHYTALSVRCRQIVQSLADEEGWQLPPAGQAELAAAILPFVIQARQQDDAGIRTIAHNYNQFCIDVEHMRSNSDEAGQELWLAWYPRFTQWLREEGVPAERLDDLSQDAFLRAKRSLEIFRFECTLTTYFHSVVRFCYLQWLRAEAVQRRRLAELAEEQDEAGASPLADPAPPIEDEVLSHNLLAAVRAEIERVLQGKDAQIILLHDIEQTFIDPVTGKEEKWTLQAIGERIGITHTAVSRRRQKVLKRLANNPYLKQLFTELLGGKRPMS